MPLSAVIATSIPKAMRYFASFCLFLVIQASSFSIVSAQTFRDESALLGAHPGESALGASLVDVNSDGLVDIYRRKRLLLQQSDGTMLDVFEATGLVEEEDAIPFGAIFGDYDNNGFVDLFFMDLTAPSKLYRNQAGIGFSEVNAVTGIDGNLQPVQGSVWGDFNEDGQLDLFVGIDGGVSRLFLQEETEFFREVSQEIGLVYQAAYGVAASDYDQDGDMDILLTQCFAPMGSEIAENVLLRNDGNTFTNVSSDIGITDDLSSWGAVWLDYDNDGWMDFYVVNTDRGNSIGGGSPGINTLYRNNGAGEFIDVSFAAGVQGDSSSNNISVAAADFDNDGWVDLFVVSSNNPHNLYRNNGDGTFTDILSTTNIEHLASQAVSVADVNGDGWIDILVPSFRDQLLINEGGDNHYLKIATRSWTSNHFGVGTRLDLYAGGLHQVREISAGEGMTSQNYNLSAHFGLGNVSLVDSLVVKWPSGTIERILNVDSNQEITIVEGIGLNNTPTPFSLLEPDGAGTIENGQVSFVWEEAIDDELDPISYTLYLNGPGIDTTFTDLQNTTYSVEGNNFIDGQIYRWTISATDGHSVRGTQYFEFTSPANVDLESVELTEKLTELSAYPNPFQTSIKLSYEIAHTSHVVVTVYDLLGHMVLRLLDQAQPPGSHEILWDGRNSGGRVAVSGLYFVRIETEGQSMTRVITRL